MQTETIYMPLANEGTSVWRPVSAKVLSPALFELEVPEPEDEEWLYRAAKNVLVEHRVFADGKCGFAVAGEASSLPVWLTSTELDIVQNALNEICHGIAMGDDFETRIGSKLADARALLTKIATVRRT
ncbi:hypothetical protein [Granulicella sp. L46]|uniref:hypothetical protein n=1 Tax=Granulicella sp. L46 TaxID=1641865 RepID=UPI00131D0021|nr:hypothetical protein [Granulicella sp. L46]